MKKGIRIIVITAVTVVMMMSMSVNALAVEENVEVTGASSLGFSMPTAPVFTAATHSSALSLGSFITFNGSNDNLILTDETGTNSGWKFSIAATDFYIQGVDDPTDGGSDAMDIFVPSGAWMFFSIDNSAEGINKDGAYTLESGFLPLTGITVPADKVLFFGAKLPSETPNCSVSATDTINAIAVDAGYGAGKYKFDLNYIISIPEWLPAGTKIDSSATGGGRFDDMTVGLNDYVQVFEGVYTTNITYSVCCNPAS